MKGLELSERYYYAYGKKMIEEKFPMLKDRAAAGLAGPGSECLGFDDAISADHDYGPSFCLWLTREDYEKYGICLMEEYRKLPKDFEGVEGRIESAHGGGRVGVLCIPDFYYGLLGREQAPENNKEWLRIPESALCTATNGKVFEDPLGEFSKIRRKLLDYYPEDVRIKKIAARAAVMAQSGQYNYARAMKRGEKVAAKLALAEFMKNTISMVYLLNKRYTPFYKWMHRGMKELSVLPEIGDILNLLAEMEDQSGAWEGAGPSDYLYTLNRNDKCVIIIEAICSLIVQELAAQKLTEGEDNFLENHTMTLMRKIKDPYIRSLHVMEG
ncbi:MAG TPA: hypothetical protein DCZ40_13735 [Lachnospiraceae bacterium]|nr:hypothetical protein [Lachnospiraceae bacterium]